MPAQKIEDVIMAVLQGDARRNALDFVAYLRTNEIPLEESENYWEVAYKDRCVCFLYINGAGEKPGPWTIWSDQEPGAWASWPGGDDHGEPRDFPMDAHTKEIAWANVNFCGSCGGDCSPGKRKTILGRDFDNVCGSAMAFTNPDTEALDCAKKMVALRKREIDSSAPQ